MLGADDLKNKKGGRSYFAQKELGI